jgi:hypothetical protein
MVNLEGRIKKYLILSRTYQQRKRKVFNVLEVTYLKLISNENYTAYERKYGKDNKYKFQLINI